jgi:NADH:ubiquinone oxidoreductase subunit E
MQRELGIEAGQTTRDGLFSIEVVACIGACGLAPVVAMPTASSTLASRAGFHEEDDQAVPQAG